MLRFLMVKLLSLCTRLGGVPLPSLSACHPRGWLPRLELHRSLLSCPAAHAPGPPSPPL